jgi:hypothetical protein
MKKITQQNNFIYLFISLMILLFSMSIFKFIDSSWLSTLIEMVLFAVLFIGLQSIKSGPSWIYIVYTMMSLLAALFLSQRFLENTIFIDTALLSILLVFFVGSFHMSYKQILMSKEVDQNMIIGSLVLYLLLGLIWSILYLLLIMIFPDGFNGLEPISWRENFTRVTYFSFVTLTTLGYGDISPKNSITQFFVYTEAIVGVFYMATFVSSIVSARLNHHNTKKS